MLQTLKFPTPLSEHDFPFKKTTELIGPHQPPCGSFILVNIWSSTTHRLLSVCSRETCQSEGERKGARAEEETQRGAGQSPARMGETETERDGKGAFQEGEVQQQLPPLGIWWCEMIKKKKKIQSENVSVLLGMCSSL